MARVKCIMMQRNEGVLLLAWMKYYGYLFGFDNLIVFDNGSTDPEINLILRTFELCGVVIRREFVTTDDFHAKGSHFRNVILHLDSTEDYDFALPVDCDEFLALLTPSGLSCDRDEIHTYLDTLIGEERALKIGETFYNSLKNPGSFWIDRYPKTFIAAGQVDTLDHGFHAISSRKFGDERREVSLTYLHMHNKPFRKLIDHAARKLRGFVDVDDKPTLARYAGPGVHLVRYFFMSEQDYLNQCDDKVLVIVPAFINMLRALGVSGDVFGNLLMPDFGGPDDIGVLFTNPVVGRRRDYARFDGGSYLRLNPDVAAIGWPAIMHYLYHGNREGRRF